MDDFTTAWLFRKLQLDRLSRPSKPQRSAKPGWYYDREKQAEYRYWDGSAWTDQTADELPAPAATRPDS